MQAKKPSQTDVKERTISLLKKLHSERFFMSLDKIRHYESRIVQLNTGLVIDTVKRWPEVSQMGISEADLIQAGMMGMLKAIRRFEPNKNHAFSSYAIPLIKGEILHFLRDHNSNLLKVPRDWIEKYSKVRREYRYLLANGYRVTLADVALSMGIQRREWRQIEEALARHPNLDTAEDEQSEQPENNQELQNLIKQKISTLPDLDGAIVMLRVFDKLTPEQIANKLSIPLETVQPAITRAFNLLKQELSECRH